MLVELANDERGQRFIGVVVAVLHHGLACFAEGTQPASSGTMLNTAQRVTKYISAGTIEREPEQRIRK